MEGSGWRWTDGCGRQLGGRRCHGTCKSISRACKFVLMNFTMRYGFLMVLTTARIQARRKKQFPSIEIQYTVSLVLFHLFTSRNIIFLVFAALENVILSVSYSSSSWSYSSALSHSSFQKSSSAFEYTLPYAIRKYINRRLII